MPATPSANTIGIDSRISATKTMATVASSINGPGQCWGSPCGSGHHREAVDGDQDAADHGRRIEPGEIDFEAGRRECAVEQAELEAVPRSKEADARYQRVIETVDPELGGLGQAVHEHREHEMRA